MSRDRCAIAIVGMAGRFAKAPDVATFWRNLCAGVEGIRRFEDADLEDAFDAGVRASAAYVKARSILDDPGSFDASFFGMHAREAELTDPQHRVFLECCWEALEDAGYDPATYPGAIGVYAGCSISSYLLRHVLRDRRGVESFTSDYQVGSYPELLGAGYDFLATRVSYKLNLRGPAMTMQSACSTSLLSVAQACQALMLHQAAMMLAGGVSISFPQRRGYVYQDGGMVSRDGHCRTFDAQASGTVFGDGAGVVLLKRLDDALADGDSVYAVIRGFGVNNDGSDKVGYSAPSIDGQAAALRAAYAMADVEPQSIGYVECHGTATPLGDPIEVAALKKAFGPASGDARCALGSVKTNIGHVDVASGVTGLIKAALAVRHGTIPPTLHFTAPNPRIEFGSSPFFVNTRLCKWPIEGETRRAAVSSFGLGGTNVHLVLESTPVPPCVAEQPVPQLLVLSARSAPALAAARRRLAAALRTGGEDGARLGDVAYTLQRGRRPFSHRCTIAAASVEEAVRKLEQPAPERTGRVFEREPVVAFMFPGQGAQYAEMGRELYEHVPVFREVIDQCAQILLPLLGLDLRALLYPPQASQSASERFRATALAQPSLFAVEYALACVWMRWGIRPAAMIGHSLGEFVAACLAGVLTLEEAIALVAERGKLMQELPAGAMLAVRRADADLAEYLAPPIDLAAVNAPDLSVVSGPLDAIDALEVTLNERGIVSRRLHTSHAFHSSMMDPVIAPLTRRAAEMRLSQPTIPYVSCVSGDWTTPEEATSPAYWGRHCREPVRFAAGLATLVAGGVDALIEVGPGATLSTFAFGGAAKNGGPLVLRSLPGAERVQSDLTSLLESAGRLWVAGGRIDWPELHAPAKRMRVPLPTYPFERTRYWMDSLPESPSRAGESALAERAVTEEPHVDTTADRAQLAQELIELLEELSGESLSGADPRSSFLELGFDSLFLGRFVQQLQTRYGVAVSFRQLLSDLPSVAVLSEHVAAQIPPRPQAVHVAPAPATVAAAPTATTTLSSGSPIESVMREQLEAMQHLMRDQLQTLQILGSAPPGSQNGSTSHAIATAPPSATGGKAADGAATAEAEPSRFDAFRIVSNAATSELTAAQQRHIEELVARTTARTAGSKRLTQRYRPVLADPRVAAGFRAEWKEMVYPITCVRAKGSRIWDADGNEYIDLLNGFGQTAFGHAPDFVVDAVAQQLRRGFAIGPQTELAGEVAMLFCELTGNERVTFCNTGSEAVMAALRVARTVTGRNRVVVFAGAYHGQFDEVLVKAARSSHRSLPVAAGIPSEAVANMTVLTYGAPESLDWIREHANELAAVVVEPVQSRHPSLQPKEFLQELRRITEVSGTAFVFDEVVTGFRMHPAGMQAVFGVRADLATYGKVVGGGLPIGILAGKARFMDALDGGSWDYGDDSFPQIAPTFFAGTFVRHPLVMAAVLAVLRHIKAQGPALQEALGVRTAGLVERLNRELEDRRISTRIETYGSLFYLNLANEDRLSGLVFYHLRNRGVYVQEGFPCFLTTEHTGADIDAIVAAFSASLDELQAVGILPAAGPPLRTEQPPARTSEVPLTEEQTEIWLCAQLGDGASCAFNESVTLRMNGSLDERAFEATWDRIVARHESMRASFTPTGEAMRIAPTGSITLNRSDLTDRSRDAAEAAFAEIVAHDARTPFDLVAGPLVRGHLIRLDQNAHAFVLTAHHIVCDGWSMNVILEECAAIYGSLCRGECDGLQAPLGFSKYALRQAQRDQAAQAKIETYWLKQFDLPCAPLDLPADRSRPSKKSFNGGTRSTHIERELYAAIKKAGARHGCTLFVTLLAAFQALIGRLSDRSDLIVGIPTAGQSLLEGEILVGHCVDFLPIRTAWERATSLADLLSIVKKRVLDAYEHQSYTLGTLVRKLAPQRELNRLPLAEVQFNLERLAGRMHLPNLDIDVEPNPKAFVNFDLFLNVVESDNGLRIDCDYSTDLFDSATIDRWINYYRALLTELVRDSAQSVSHVSYLTSEERHTLLADSTAQAYPRDLCVHELVEAQASLRPDKIAVRFGEASLTYAELDRRSNTLAQRLLRLTGGARRPIGVCVDRSLDLPVALLATLKSGSAYVPLDPTHPDGRLRGILAEVEAAAVILTDTADREIVPPGIPIVDLSHDALSTTSARAPEVRPSPDDLAYMIYTSGSTGAPKGVEITHRSVVNLLSAMSKAPGLASNDVFLAVTTIAFDIAALEVFLPLVVGASVVIATENETADGFKLASLVRSSGATAMQATPSMWRVLLEAGLTSAPGLKMLCGGELLSRELAHRLLATGAELWNMYGPTETTIWSSCAKVSAGESPITVGRPIANTQFFVLDRHDEPVPAGVSGHLHIAGDGVARGYVKRSELTEERFIANPFGPGRMYRTGDRARVLPGGEVQILGRIDHQVKLRGFRIEPGEIEAVLEKRCGLAAALVTVRELASDDAKLVAYYVQRPGAPQKPETLRAMLTQELPEYMIPQLWVPLDALPLSPSGKVDRASLPDPDPLASREEPFLSPETATEVALVRIWTEVLHLERVGVNDDLFALGVDSIQLFQIAARANAEGMRLAAKELFKYPTIAAVARHLDEAGVRGSEDARNVPPPIDLRRIESLRQSGSGRDGLEQARA